MASTRNGAIRQLKQASETLWRLSPAISDDKHAADVIAALAMWLCDTNNEKMANNLRDEMKTFSIRSLPI